MQRIRSVSPGHHPINSRWSPVYEDSCLTLEVIIQEYMLSDCKMYPTGVDFPFSSLKRRLNSLFTLRPFSVLCASGFQTRFLHTGERHCVHLWKSVFGLVAAHHEREATSNQTFFVMRAGQRVSLGKTNH